MTGSINRRLVVALTLVAGLLSCIGMTQSAHAVVPGGIVQLSGAAGCISSAAPCTSGHDLGFVTEIAIPPDGRNVYAVGYIASTLTVFDRDPQTGALTQKPGTAGCLRTTASAQCQAVPGLGAPFGITVSPDGASVYVANYGGDTVMAFSRAADGSLTQKPGAAGCISNTGAPPCADARALNGPVGLRISSDGKHLYVAAYDDGSIVALNIGPDGGLTQVADGPGGSGCVQNTPGPDGCADGRAIPNLYAVTLSPDGAAVYASSNSGSVSAQARDAATGRLSPIGGTQGCVVGAATDACGVVADLAGASYDLTATAGQVYVPVTGNARVLTFDRQPSGGIVRRAGAAGCVSNGVVAGCTTGRALDTPTGIAATADGEDIYVSATSSSGVVELDRAANGTVTPRAGTRGCAVQGALLGCATIGGLPGTAHDVAVSPDGRFVYLSGTGGGIAVFKRDSSGPVCSGSTVTVQAGSVGPLPFPCSDPDGDALTYSLINPPTLGSLGAIDNAAGTIVYAAPQGQNGTATFTFKAAYSGFEAEGSITVNVVGAAPPGGGGGGTVQAAGIDSDKDGFFAGQDCNDGNAAIRPGAVEVRGNRLDENCDGLAEAFPTLTSGVASNWDVKGTRFTLMSLQVTQQFPKGWKVQIRCSGKPRCSFRTKSLRAGKVKRGASTIIASLSRKQRKFRAGQTVEVWVSAPNFNTKVARLVLRKGKIPTTQPFCVLPGQTKAQKTCT